MERTMIFFLMVSVLTATVLAHDGHPEHSTFEQAEAIINAEIPCESLAVEQLEALGDYYMEQMHPGAAHERMDEMMGGEGSDALAEMHIRMGKAFYCGDSTSNDAGMLNRMMMTMGGAMMDGTMMGGGMMGGGMASGCMMGSHANSKQGGGYSMMVGNGGVMGGTGWFGMSLLWLVYVALAAFVFGMIFWWTYKLMNPGRKG